MHNDLTERDMRLSELNMLIADAEIELSNELLDEVPCEARCELLIKRLEAWRRELSVYGG